MSSTETPTAWRLALKQSPSAGDTQVRLQVSALKGRDDCVSKAKESSKQTTQHRHPGQGFSSTLQGWVSQAFCPSQLCFYWFLSFCVTKEQNEHQQMRGQEHRHMVALKAALPFESLGPAMCN